MVFTIPSFPVVTNDDGSLLVGTPFSEAYNNALEAALAAQLFDELVGLWPVDTAQEVYDARGNLASLDARLSAVVDDDGNPVLAAGLLTNAVAQTTLGFRNLWDDSRFEIWPDPAANAEPAGWTLSGTGAALVRAGAGQADTTVVHNFGGFTVKLTYGSATAKLTRALIPAASFPTGLQGKTITVGIYCKTGVQNQASVVIDDGATATRGGTNGNAEFHSGSGNAEWIYLTHTISGSATKLDLYLEVAQSGDAYFSGGVVAISDLAVSRWTPERWGKLIIGTQHRGDPLTTGTVLNESRFTITQDMAIFLRTWVQVKTAPTDASLLYDVNKNAADSLYTTKVTVASTEDNNSPGDAPDGDYDHRCFVAGDFFTYDCDQVGSTEPGEEATLTFELKTPMGTFDLLEAANQ